MSSQPNNQKNVPYNAADDLKQVEIMGKDVLHSIQSLRELLDARATAIIDCRKSLEEQCAQFEEDRTNFSRERTDLCETYEKREKELATLEAHLKETEADISAKAAAIDEDRRNFEATNQKMIEQSAKYQEEIAELDRRKSELAQAEENINHERSQVETAQESLSIQQNEVLQKQEEMKKREAEISNLTQMLEQKGQEIEAREAALAATQQEWNERLKEFATTRNSLASLQQELAKELTQVSSQQKDELLPTLNAPGASDEAKASMERFQKLCRDARRKAIGADAPAQQA
jgi:chromosome segregation ATPase